MSGFILLPLEGHILLVLPDRVLPYHRWACPVIGASFCSLAAGLRRCFCLGSWHTSSPPPHSIFPPSPSFFPSLCVVYAGACVCAAAFGRRPGFDAGSHSSVVPAHFCERASLTELGAHQFSYWPASSRNLLVSTSPVLGLTMWDTIPSMCVGAGDLRLGQQTLY